VRVADVTTDSQFLGFPRGHPVMRSFLGVPIFVRGVVYGDLYLAEKVGGEFTQDDEELVTLLAVQAGITIEKARIHDGAVRWLRQLEALDGLMQNVLEERDVSRVLLLVARRLRELIRARAVLIALPAPAGRLRVAVAEGEAVSGMVGYDFPADSKHGRVFARGHSERIDAILDDPEFNQVVTRRFGVTAILVPLVCQGRTIGIVSAFDKDGADPRFSDHDLRLAEGIGARAALAVHLSERVTRETVDAILATEERERRRIARELHDEAGSALTAILLGLAAIEGTTELAAAHSASTALRGTAKSAIESVGRLAFALRPAVLDEFGLVPALKGLGEGLSGGPRLAFEIDLPADVRLPPELETSLFRITQEALTNVVKHAEATTARVALRCRKRTLALTVEDDGCGFAPAETDGGFGLIGIRERVASVNGALAIESASGVGTRLVLEIPLA
jgi:signal transduction histidine kinase